MDVLTRTKFRRMDLELAACLLSSSAMNRTATLLTAAGVGLLAYAVYFDYKRRNDAAFRKKLRKEKKKVEKTVATAPAPSAAAGSATVTEAELRAAMEKVKSETVPPTPEEKETYFMNQVGMGEQLCAQGPMFALPAAMCFFRALRVYPSPVELIVIYQQTVPEHVFKLVMEMTQLDVKDRVEGYFDHFPSKHFNVSVKAVDAPDANGAVVRKRVLVVNKDFAAGEIIYKEQPLVSALDADLEGVGSHCTHCLREISSDAGIRPEGDKFGAVYCSKECDTKSKAQSQNLLFGAEPPVPLEIGSMMPPEAAATREKAQDDFVKFIKESGRAAPMLVARFIARQVAAEVAKMVPADGDNSTNPADELSSGDYSLYDHVERLRFLELDLPEGEAKPFREVLQSALPGLEQFVTDERYATLKGKMSYNAYGVTYSGGRDDKPVAATERPEDQERTRTPFGTSRQIGSAFFAVSSYIQHNCDPSARLSFENGTSEAHLIAGRDLKAGDEVTVAFVDVTKREDESTAETRRRRRMELARGWRFACPCERCASELEATPNAEADPVQKDESKVEEVVTRIDAQSAEVTPAQAEPSVD
ncbi:hypothetical protein OF83DRAFT_1135181 [Amylostereum chailletii]|nr:hypothetical protein OF83DRAFT_1135181 [Amylostereum chailletii]